MSCIDNYIRIEKEISDIARAAGRDSGGIRIVAVTKTFPGTVIQDAINAGIRLFGENKVQEAKGKIPLLRGDFTFHMVGHLQSNKARDAVRLFDMIHSIDKESTARRVDEEAEMIGKRQKILIQVNSSGEESKSGVTPGETLDIVRKISDLKHIEIRGLMTMAPFTDDAEAIRRSFRVTRELLESINDSLGYSLRELSMGMTSDYRIAVEEGATMVRIGTAIFGTRDYS